MKGFMVNRTFVHRKSNLYGKIRLKTLNLPSHSMHSIALNSIFYLLACKSLIFSF